MEILQILPLIFTLNLFAIFLNIILLEINSLSIFYFNPLTHLG